LFNLVTTLFFIPFNKVLIKLADLTLPEIKPKEPQTSEAYTLNLDTRLLTSPSIAISQAGSALKKVADASFAMCSDLLHAVQKGDTALYENNKKREAFVDDAEGEITDYLVKITQRDLTEQESTKLTTYIRIVHELERTSDYAYQFIESSKTIHTLSLSFSEEAVSELEVLNRAHLEIMNLTAIVHQDEHAAYEALKHIIALKEVISDICEAMRGNHIERLKAGICTLKAGIVFLQFLTGYEHIAQHCANISLYRTSEMLGSPDIHEITRRMQSSDTQRELNELALRYKAQFPVTNKIKF
jgi:phosphate:Na+ symporter